MGHPAPFNLKMMGIGNEQWGAEYLERYAAFSKVLKREHPEIALVSAAGPGPSDESFHFLWSKLPGLNADIVDEHSYANPIWFLSHSDRYDQYDRSGPKVFMGEYAAQSVAIVSPKNRNNLECALAEAAYMTGMERNAAVVRMASYAPLFGNADAWQWTPNLIWDDSSRVYRTPNYYVQQLFMRNRGDTVLPVSNDAPVHIIASGRIGVGTEAAAAEFKDLLVTRGGETLWAADFSAGTNGWSGDSRWSVKEGVYRQADPGVTSLSFAGDTNWGDYTLSLKARKLGGAEGFIIAVRASGPEEYVTWRIGGWGNQSSGLMSRLGLQDAFIAKVPGTITTNRWYDIRVELKGSQINCYLDGRLVQSADVPARRTPTLFTSAVRDDKTGEIILKVVNPGEQETPASIQLRGLKSLSPTGQVIELTGGKLTDENSFNEPGRIAPTTSPLNEVKPEFTHTFKPRSLTVLKIQPAGE